MRGNRRVGTRPELALRRLLHQQGYRYRVDHQIRVADLTVRPDIVFTRRRIAIFVDGCFWHSCPLHGSVPATNQAYWVPKLARNAERDRRVSDALTKAGWLVLRVWEHEQPAEAAESIRASWEAAANRASSKTLRQCG